MLRPWLRLFRVVNLPTVPGDVLAGVAAFSFAGNCYAPCWVAWAAGLSVLIYMFGLVDNDIVGATTDIGRPISSGEISLRSATVARAITVIAIFGVAFLVNLPAAWHCAALVLLLVIFVYNRTKSAILMGCCRGLNVGCGAAVAYGAADRIWLDWRILPLIAVAVLFTGYIAAVTKYSEGEELDPVRKARVGMLIGAHIYLQLTVLIVCALLIPSAMPLMVAGAVLLVVLRIMKHTLPRISAS